MRNVEEVYEQDGNTHIVGGNQVTWQVKIDKRMYAQVRRDLSAIVSGARSYRVRARSSEKCLSTIEETGFRGLPSPPAEYRANFKKIFVLLRKC